MIKLLLLTLLTVTCILFNVSSQQSFVSSSKTDLIGTWRICHALNIEETTDTLSFQRATPDCSDNNCGEHQFSFRSNGVIEFVFTKGCDSGFNSVSRNPKRWILVESDNTLKLISTDGFIDVYAIQKITESTLILTRRRDLE